MLSPNIRLNMLICFFDLKDGPQQKSTLQEQLVFIIRG